MERQLRADLLKMKKGVLRRFGAVSGRNMGRRLKEWQKNMNDAAWRKSAAPALERMRSMKKLLERKEYPHPDDFFFTIEDLPYMGKEYWFLHFVVPGSDEQVVITAGRSQGPVLVNKTRVTDASGKKAGANVVDCAAVCWMFTDKKEVFIDSGGQVGLEKRGGKKTLFFRKGRNEVTFRGAYPRFDIVLKKAGKEAFSAKATAKRSGLPWEMPPYLTVNPLVRGLGALLVNYYFDFEGRMKGRRVKGRAYLQKVVATIPLAPWNWVRVEFKNGDTLDYFSGKPLGEKAPKVKFMCNDFVEIQGARHKMGDLKFQSYLDGETRRWVLSGKNLFLAMESYSLQPFSMRNKTRFQYDEYLVRVTDFVLKTGAKTYTLKDMGPSSGIVEDAYGYLL